jgi:glycosyltransferase involved in cell wall biosynthesis
MTHPRITFAVPYYQNLSYLKLAIQSIIEQQCADWQAIILDDRGGEDAEELVLSFHDERLVYVRNDVNLGLAENWNKGIQLSETEFVTIFHSDDLLLPNYIDEMLCLMDETPQATAGHCRTIIVDEFGEKFWSFTDEFKKLIRPRGKDHIETVGEMGLASLINGSWIFCPTLCYRKEMLQGYKFNSKWKFVVDVDFMSQILFAGGLIVGTTTNAYQYRRHRENQTAVLTKSLLRFQEEIFFLNQIHQRSAAVNWNDCARRARRKTVTRIHLIYQGIGFMLKGNFSTGLQAFTVAIRGRFQSSERIGG